MRAGGETQGAELAAPSADAAGEKVQDSREAGELDELAEWRDALRAWAAELGVDVSDVSDSTGPAGLEAAARRCAARAGRATTAPGAAEQRARRCAARHAERALGVEADSPAAAAADAAVVAPHGALCAMTWAPRVYGPPAPAARAAGAAGAILPDLAEGRPANAEYDLERIADARAAAAFGPLASTAEGPSYKLVERLRSIRVERAKPGPNPGAPLPVFVEAGAPLLVSTDEGATSREIPARGARWAPGAGSRPVVTAYGRAAADAVFAALAESPRPGRAELDAASAAAPEGLLDPGALAADLAAAHALAYAEAFPGPPPDAAEYLRVVAPDEFDFRGVAAAALSRAARRAAQEECLRQASRGKLVAAPVASREITLSRAVGAAGMAAGLARRLGEALWSSRAVAAAGAAPPRERAAAFAAAFRAAAARAAAEPVAIAPFVPKVWAASL